MIYKNKYERLAGSSISDFQNIELKTYVPSPEEKDYKRGYITRYFFQKSNDESAYILEISKEKFGELNQNPFCKCVSLNWRITGDYSEIRESNSKSVKLASEVLKSIELYLPNKIQFSKK